MTKRESSRTKRLFDSVVKLYKQGQLLLLDADRLMLDRGWESMHTTGPAELSNSLSLPSRWYARWAQRFYMPSVTEGEEAAIDHLVFVSIHFASDHDTDVDEPIVSAGRLLYDDVMDSKKAKVSYGYWMCKSWFWSDPHKTLANWRYWDRPGYIKNLKGIETFEVPLYDITSSKKLEKFVIERLFKFK